MIVSYPYSYKCLDIFYDAIPIYYNENVNPICNTLFQQNQTLGTASFKKRTPKIYYVQGTGLGCLVGFIRKSAYLNIFCVTVNRLVGRFLGLVVPDAARRPRPRPTPLTVLAIIDDSHFIKFLR